MTVRETCFRLQSRLEKWNRLYLSLTEVGAGLGYNSSGALAFPVACLGFTFLGPAKLITATFSMLFLLFSVGDGIRGFLHARHVLCHRLASPSPYFSVFLTSKYLLLLFYSEIVSG